MILTKEGITAEQLETIKRGMWRVVNESGGTARGARSELTTISGKTGTAQTGNPKQPTNAW
ncbi:MAG: penicillin-binding transpeptidase domain-containing protein, partial [Verrucomicrobiota bacterium]